MRLGDEIVDFLEGYKGLKEKPGDENEPLILEIASMLGLTHITSDSQNWCGVAAGFAVSSVGSQPPPNFTIASNWKNYGAPIGSCRPRRGDVVIITGKDPANVFGWHVAFYVGEDEENVWLLGGNQVGQVREYFYAKDRIDTIRRPVRGF